MANTVQFLGYLRASGRTPFLRVYGVSFSGTYAQNYAEVVNLNAALNPNGLEDPQVPNTTTPFVPPMILSATLDGWDVEIQIGGNGTPGEFGVNFYTSNGTAPIQMASGQSYSSDFPANSVLGGNGQVLIGIMDTE
jgi:hypothetical protein